MKLRWLVSPLLLLLVTAQAWANPPRTTKDLAQSVGINTHLEARNSSYYDLDRVVDNLNYLGVLHIRDAAPRSLVGLATYQELVRKADGVRFNLIAMGDPLRLMPAIEALASHVIAVEGPNEVDRTPVRFQGMSGPPAVIANQQALYEAVHGSALLNGSASGQPRRTPVLNFTLARPDYSAYGDLSQAADLMNVHAYATKGVPPFWMIPGNVKKARKTLDRPMVITETNYPTIIQADGNGVNESVQAKWILNVLLDSFRNGFVRTYIYQLQDGVADPTGHDFEAHFGLFRFDGTPKPAAIGLHNFMRVLRQGEGHAAATAEADLPYSVTLPYNAFDLLLTRPDGAFVLVLWAEPAIWNASQNTEIPAPTIPATVTFRNGPHDVEVYDPLAGAAAIASYRGKDQVIVSLTDHPVLLVIR